MTNASEGCDNRCSMSRREELYKISRDALDESFRLGQSASEHESTNHLKNQVSESENRITSLLQQSTKQSLILKEMETRCAELESSNSRLLVAKSDHDRNFDKDRRDIEEKVRTSEQLRAREQHEQLVKRVEHLATDNQIKSVRIKQLEEVEGKWLQYEKTLANSSRIGTVNENNVFAQLQQTFGELFLMENVSKSGQGHQGDFLLTSDDGIRIMVDAKWRSVPTKNGIPQLKKLEPIEIEAFYKAVDTSTPDGAIIYCNIIVHNQDNVVHRLERGQTKIAFISKYDYGALVKTIYNMTFEVRMQREQKTTAPAEMKGGDELKQFHNIILDSCSFLKGIAVRQGEITETFQKQWPAHQKEIESIAQTTHEAAKTVVGVEVLTEIKKLHIPAKRGGQTKLKPKGDPKAAKRSSPSDEKKGTSPTGFQQPKRARQSEKKAPAEKKATSIFTPKLHTLDSDFGSSNQHNNTAIKTSDESLLF